MLTLMAKLKTELSILFSIHILHDAEKVSDAMIFLANGKVIESGPLDDLRKKYASYTIELQFSKSFSANKERCKRTLQAIPYVYTVSFERHTFTLTASNVYRARQFILQKCPLIRFAIKEVSLEQLFMNVIERCNG